MAVGARQYWTGVEGDFVVLGCVRVRRVDNSMAELAITCSIGGTPLQHAARWCVAGVAGVLMCVGNEIGTSVAACGTGCGRSQCGMGWRKVVCIVGASGLMAVYAIAGSRGSISCGSGNQCTSHGSMTGVASSVCMDSISPVCFVVAADTGGSGQDVCKIMVNRSFMVQII